MGRYKARRSMNCKFTDFYKPMAQVNRITRRQEKILLEEFHDLNTFYKQVLEILIFNFKKFQDGKNTSLDDNFSLKKHENLLCLIQEWSNKDNILATALTFRQIHNPYLFRDYRKLAFLILDILLLSRQTNQLNCSLSIQNKDLNYKLEQLNNFENLKKHINQLIKSKYDLTNALNCETTVNTQLEIKTEYLIYINRHGFPENGLFESEKLLTILNELKKC